MLEEIEQSHATKHQDILNQSTQMPLSLITKYPSDI